MTSRVPLFSGKSTKGRHPNRMGGGHFFILGGSDMVARMEPELTATGLEECDAPQPMRGARILCEALVREGVDTVFGYPGGAVLHIYDELLRARDRINHILVRHEQGAVHMAEGYAKATGKVGVVLV